MSIERRQSTAVSEPPVRGEEPAHRVYQESERTELLPTTTPLHTCGKRRRTRERLPLLLLCTLLLASASGLFVGALVGHVTSSPPAHGFSHLPLSPRPLPSSSPVRLS